MRILFDTKNLSFASHIEDLIAVTRRNLYDKVIDHTDAQCNLLANGSRQPKRLSYCLGQK